MEEASLWLATAMCVVCVGLGRRLVWGSSCCGHRQSTGDELFCFFVGEFIVIYAKAEQIVNRADGMDRSYDNPHAFLPLPPCADLMITLLLHIAIHVDEVSLNSTKACQGEKDWAHALTIIVESMPCFLIPCLTETLSGASTMLLQASSLPQARHGLSLQPYGRLLQYSVLYLGVLMLFCNKEPIMMR
jgi:hypothetical protein